MGFSFNRRKKILPSLTMNVSKSGVSFTGKAGPLSANSRGQRSVNLGNGLRWTGRKKRT